MPLVVSAGHGVRIAMMPGLAPAAAPQLEEIVTDYITQRPRDNWCWCACAVMVAHYFNVMNPQDGQRLNPCALASSVYGADCCANPFDEADCDHQGAWPQQAYNHLGIRYNPDIPPVSTTVLPLDKIRSEIVDQKRPVEVLYKWIGNDGQQTGSHVALIVGIWTDGDLKVFDPYFGPDDKLAYDFICQARKYGKWEGTYYGFEAPARVAAGEENYDGQLSPGGIAKNSQSEQDRRELRFLASFALALAEIHKKGAK